MRHATSAVIHAYLGLFSLLASDREHARSEHRLIEGSIEDARRRRLAEGRGTVAATLAAIVDHLGELQPLALYRKTRADAAYAPGSGQSGSHWPEIVVLAIGGLLALAAVNGVDRSSNPPFWVFVALLPVVAGTAVVLSVIAALRRRAPLALIGFAVAIALWPVWHWRLPLPDGVAAVAMSAVTLLVLTATLRHRASRPGVALLALAPIALHLSRPLGLHVLWLRRELGVSIGEMAGLERIAALTLYLLLIAVALRLLSRPSAQHPASKDAA